MALTDFAVNIKKEPYYSSLLTVFVKNVTKCLLFEFKELIKKDSLKMVRNIWVGDNFDGYVGAQQTMYFKDSLMNTWICLLNSFN